MLKIVGYPDRYSVAPGETIRFMVSLEEGDAFDASLVRVIHGDCNPAGPGLKFAAIDHPANGRYPGRRQSIDAGSCMVARGVPALAEGFSFTAYLWPTLPARPMQVVAAQWDAEKQRRLQDRRRSRSADAHRRRRLRQDGPACARLPDALAHLVRDPGQGRCQDAPVRDRTASRRRPGHDGGCRRRRRQSRSPAGQGKGLPYRRLSAAGGTVGEHFDGKVDSPKLVGQGNRTSSRAGIFPGTWRPPECSTWGRTSATAGS